MATAAVERSDAMRWRSVFESAKGFDMGLPGNGEAVS
jgi:hypothetical protein